MPESETDTWSSAPFTSSSSSSSPSLLGALIHSFSGHTVLLHSPDVGSEAGKPGGSTQDLPCLLRPHGHGPCSDMEAPGEAGSSGRGRHGGLSIRGGGLTRVHPRGCSSSLKVGEEPHVAPGVPEPPPRPGGLRAQPWMTSSRHLTRGRGWY